MQACDQVTLRLLFSVDMQCLLQLLVHCQAQAEVETASDEAFMGIANLGADHLPASSF